MMISWMNAMVIRMSRFLTLSDVIKEANDYLDSKPVFNDNAKDTRTSFVPNLINTAYANIIDVFVCPRYAIFKFRDVENLVEYQLSVLPWRSGFSFMSWDDSYIDDGEDMRHLSMGFITSEEQFFQESLKRDLSWVELVDVINAKKLHDRIFEYYGITPCDDEQDQLGDVYK